MATFKTEIYKHQKKADGTWNVKIRITRNRETKYLSTSIYATKDDLTGTFKIKSQDCATSLMGPLSNNEVRME